jgi:CheY-like chemotaxis protein
MLNPDCSSGAHSPDRVGAAAVIDEARERFIATFSSQCDAMATLIRAVAELAPDGPIDGLRRMLHNIAGHAGGIGFPTVAAGAAAIDALIADSLPTQFEAGHAFALVTALRDDFAADLVSGSAGVIEAAAAVRPEDGPPSPASHPAREVTVMVADDDPEVTRLIDSQLRAAGYRTVIVFDGAQAVAGVDAERPDVLVLDLMLPKLSGFEVLDDMVRRGADGPRVVIVSGCGREEDVTRAFSAGAADFMTKPFNVAELSARIARLVPAESHD